MDRKTNIENFLLKKALILEKSAHPFRAAEIDKRLEMLSLESCKIDDLPKSLKYYDSTNLYKKTPFAGKTSYAFKVNIILNETKEMLSARDILKRAYGLFENLDQVDDRKNIRLVSTALNQGCIKGKYKKLTLDNVIFYSIK